MSTPGWRSAALSRGLTLAGSAAVMGAVRPQFSGHDPVEIVMVIVLLVICLGIHEAAHGWVALKCGDPTARDLGRITLNPIPHIDLFMTIVLPTVLFLWTGMIFGGAKPVPVNFHRLRHPWRDMSLVALAGPLSNMVLALLFMVALKFFLRTGLYNSASEVGQRSHDFLPRVLGQAVGFNALLAVFNLLPIPPLDGSRIMAWLLPEGIRAGYVALERFGLLLVFGLIYLSPSFNTYLYGAMDTFVRFLDRIVPITV